MGLLDHSPQELSDAELISRVRGGDVGSYGRLFSRHVDAARRLARSLVPGPDADDLVSEAFTKVLNVLRGGGGPDVAFRAYLLTAVRRVHIDRIRGQQRAVPTDDVAGLDDGVPFHDTVVEGFEGGAAARAFASLPERWQMVLWHLEVEGQKPGEIAPMLGMSANSVSALAYRAREGLRQAFLQMHAADIVDDGCARTHDMLGAYVRQGLSRRDTDKVEQHLDRCRRCTALYLELTEVNSSLAGVVGPLVLGGAAAAYLAGGGTSWVAGLGVFLGRVRDGVTSNAQAALITAGVAGVAAAATVGFLVSRTGPEQPVADPGTAHHATPAPAPQHTTPAPHRTARHRAHQTHPANRSRPAPASTPVRAAAPATTPPASPAPVSPKTPPRATPPARAPAAGPPAAPHHSTPHHAYRHRTRHRTHHQAPAPPPTPTGPTPVDVAVTVTISPSPPTLHVAVTGVPAGQHAQLTVTPLKNLKHVASEVVGSGTQLFGPPLHGPVLQVHVTAPAGYVDTAPGNNTATVSLH
ncbi:MAG: sigma-70 family RNA polymerase sigma factor [Marmoricola sp.]